jgi:hypothetical protein
MNTGTRPLVEQLLCTGTHLGSPSGPAERQEREDVGGIVGAGVWLKVEHCLACMRPGFYPQYEKKKKKKVDKAGCSARVQVSGGESWS